MLTNDIFNTSALLQSSALAALLCLNAVFLCLCYDKTTMRTADHRLPDSDIQHAEWGTVNSRLAPRLSGLYGFFSLTAVFSTRSSHDQAVRCTSGSYIEYPSN